MNDEQPQPAGSGGPLQSPNGHSPSSLPPYPDATVSDAEAIAGADPREKANGSESDAQMPIAARAGAEVAEDGQTRAQPGYTITITAGEEAVDGEGVPPGGDAEAVEALAPEPPRGQRRSQTVATIREILETFVLALAIFLAVRAVVQNFRVEGSSMYPSFVNGQYVLVNKAVFDRIDMQAISHWLPFVSPGANPERNIFHPPRRGDVIVFHPPPPNDPSKDFIKRVIGVPGDTVVIRGGQVFVNGAPVPEAFITQPTVTLNPCFSRVTLGKNHFFVMGDNRGNSSDSRAWGPIDAGEIVGRAWLIYWPSSAWKLAPNHALKVPAAAAPAPANDTYASPACRTEIP